MSRIPGNPRTISRACAALAVASLVLTSTTGSPAVATHRHTLERQSFEQTVRAHDEQQRPWTKECRQPQWAYFSSPTSLYMQAPSPAAHTFRKIKVGQVVELVRDDGSTASYEVVADRIESIPTRRPVYDIWVHRYPLDYYCGGSGIRDLFLLEVV